MKRTTILTVLVVLLVVGMLVVAVDPVAAVEDPAEFLALAMETAADAAVEPLANSGINGIELDSIDAAGERVEVR